MMTREGIFKTFRQWAHPRPPATGQTLDAEIERALANGPMRKPPSLETKELHEKTVTIRHKDETIQSLIARTGINPRQLKEWSIERIGNFVLAAERRAQDEVQEPKRGSFYIPAPIDLPSSKYAMVE
jgi:hypothetical protein